VRDYLDDSRDTVGQFLFRDEMNAGLFRGYEFSWTPSIPQNLGTAGNATEVYLADASEILIAEYPELIVDAAKAGVYSPDGSTLNSAYDRDETVIRIVAYHDINLRHSTSAAVLTNVLWG
jgi:hypothetical protein